MLKTVRNIAAGVLACLVFGAAAYAANVGVPPNNGFQMPDGTWLNGVANGVNSSYQAGITATGTVQSNAFQLPANIALIEVDTAAAGTGVNVVSALPGVEVSIYNNGSNTLTVYPTVANNPVTGAQDTINNTTSITITSHGSLYFFCAKAGVWAAK